MKIKYLFGIVLILGVGVGLYKGRAWWYSEPRAGKIVRFEDMRHSDSSSVRSAVFSPDGKSVLIETGDMKFSIRDTETGKITAFLEGARMSNLRHRFEWSSDGSRILGPSESEAYKHYSFTVWDAKTGKEVFSPSETDLEGMTFSPDGKEVLAWGVPLEANMKSFMFIFGAENGKKIEEFSLSIFGKGAEKDYIMVTAAAMSPNKREIAFCDFGKRVDQVWILDRETEKLTGVLQIDRGRNPFDFLGSLNFSALGNSILARTLEGEMSLLGLYADPETEWKSHGISAFLVGTGKPQKFFNAGFLKFQTNDTLYWGAHFFSWAQGFNPIMISYDGKVKILNLDRGRFEDLDRVGQEGPKSHTRAIAARISPDGSSVAVVMSNGQIVHWNMNAKRGILTTNFDKNDIRR